MRLSISSSGMPLHKPYECKWRVNGQVLNLALLPDFLQLERGLEYPPAVASISTIPRLR